MYLATRLLLQLSTTTNRNDIVCKYTYRTYINIIYNNAYIYVIYNNMSHPDNVIVLFGKWEMDSHFLNYDRVT